MGARKWFPSKEVTIETSAYRYVLGVYNHAEYGAGCLRVSKHLKINNYFIGHFVIVPEDQEVMVPVLIEWLKQK